MLLKFNLHLILIIVLAAVGCTSDNNPQSVQQETETPDPVTNNPMPVPVTTTIYLIRHAEKADNSADPELSAEGLQRANNWAILLQDVEFDVFYSTNYNRTLQTIAPIAAANGKQALLYNPATFTLNQVLANHRGKNVFIVGHSNTIPHLINAYIGDHIYPDMAETEFGNLYKITIVDDVVTHGMTVHN